MKLNVSTATFQKICTNGPSESVSVFFKKVVNIPLLHYLLTQLNERSI